MADETIVTLQAEKGTKFAETGECIGTWERSLVFLPKGVKPEERVRVRLHEIRPDRAGKMMYRATAAPEKEEQHWRDNGDGTASQIQAFVDWRGEIRHGRILETRPLSSREGDAIELVEPLRIVWGSDLAGTQIARQAFRRYHTFEEKVVGVELQEVDNSQYRFVRDPWVNYPVEQIVCEAMGFWLSQRLEVSPPGEAMVPLSFSSVREGRPFGHSERFQFSRLPVWCQDELLSGFPVCGCGRARYDLGNTDGYAKCEACRVEERCHRCHQEKKVTRLKDGGLICADCQKLPAYEALIEQHLPINKRQELAEMAKHLLGSRHLPKEAGEALIEATLDHFCKGYEYMKPQALLYLLGYAHYYVAAEGIYGSKFDPSALEILSRYAEARGNGLVNLTAWITGRERVAEASADFYCVQVLGETGHASLPSFTENSLATARVGKLVRGSEGSRQAAMALFKELAAHGLTGAMEKILFAPEQDYAAAIELGTRENEVVARRNQFVEVLQQHYGSCPFCGTAISSYGFSAAKLVELGREGSGLDYWCGGCGLQTALEEPTEIDGVLPTSSLIYHRRTAYQLHTLHLGEALVAELVAYHRNGGWHIQLRVFPETVDAGGEYRARSFWSQPNQAERQLAELKRERNAYLKAEAQAEDQTTHGLVQKLSFRQGTDPKTGRGQVEARVGRRLYLLGRDSKIKVQLGKEYYCREIRELANMPALRIALVSAFLEVGLSFDEEIVALERKLYGNDTPFAKEETVAGRDEEGEPQPEPSDDGGVSEEMLRQLLERFPPKH